MGKRKSATLERHALTKNQLNYQVYLKLLLCWFSKSVLTIIIEGKSYLLVITAIV